MPETLAARFQTITVLAGMTQSAALAEAIERWCDAQSPVEELKAQAKRSLERRDLLRSYGMGESRIAEYMRTDRDEREWRRLVLSIRSTSGKPELQQWTPEEYAELVDMGAVKGATGAEADEDTH